MRHLAILVGVIWMVVQCKEPLPKTSQPTSADNSEQAIPNDEPLADHETYDLFFHIKPQNSPELAQLISDITGSSEPSEVIMLYSVDVEYKTADSIQNASPPSQLGLLGKKTTASAEPAVPKQIKDVNPDQVRKFTVEQARINSKTPATSVPRAIVREGTKVYRGMELTPGQLDDIIRNGIDAPVVFFHKDLKPTIPLATTIKLHERPTGEVASKSSIYVSTSYSDVQAERYATPSEPFPQGGLTGVVFTIRVPRNKGIDVVKARGEKSRRPSNQEVAIIGRVEPTDIVGYYKVWRNEDYSISASEFHSLARKPAPTSQDGAAPP